MFAGIIVIKASYRCLADSRSNTTIKGEMSKRQIPCCIQLIQGFHNITHVINQIKVSSQNFFFSFGYSMNLFVFTV